MSALLFVVRCIDHDDSVIVSPDGDTSRLVPYPDVEAARAAARRALELAGHRWPENWVVGSVEGTWQWRLGGDAAYVIIDLSRWWRGPPG